MTNAAGFDSAWINGLTLPWAFAIGGRPSACAEQDGETNSDGFLKQGHCRKSVGNENRRGRDGRDIRLFLSQKTCASLELDAQLNRHLAVGLFLRVEIRDDARELARVRIGYVVVRVIEVRVVKEIRNLTSERHLPPLREGEGLGHTQMVDIEALPFKDVYSAVAKMAGGGHFECGWIKPLCLGPLIAGFVAVCDAVGAHDARVSVRRISAVEGWREVLPRSKVTDRLQIPTADQGVDHSRRV